MPGVHKKARLEHRGRHRAKRPQTFHTEAKAKAWAEKKGIKKYDVVRLNNGISRKVKIVVK
jgi:hypothetical protein